MIQNEFETYEVEETPLWELEIEEVTGESLEAKNREAVNQLFTDGWVLLHIYTLKYKEEDVWRERPMAIFGRPKIQEDIKRQRQLRSKVSQRSMH